MKCRWRWIARNSQIIEQYGTVLWAEYILVDLPATVLRRGLSVATDARGPLLLLLLLTLLMVMLWVPKLGATSTLPPVPPPHYHQHHSRRKSHRLCDYCCARRVLGQITHQLSCFMILHRHILLFPSQGLLPVVHGMAALRAPQHELLHTVRTITNHLTCCYSSHR